MAVKSYKRARISSIPKQLHVVVVWGEVKNQPFLNLAKAYFQELMLLCVGENYGILVKEKKMYYGCIGYVEEPLALPLDAKFGLKYVGVWCTHQFVDELKSYRRRARESIGYEEDALSIVVYANPKTKMSDKSCNKFCQIKNDGLGQNVENCFA